MIGELVSILPEVYQPIYGHPELSSGVSRSCADRLAQIVRIHDALMHLLARPLKVLDLGCAQGYFSFNLAERGSQVHGVDFLDKNIAVCNALVQEHPDLQVSFETARVEDVISSLTSGQYDLVLGLSVFHHVVHENGAIAVKAMLEQVAAKSGALIVELALRKEPLYWGPAQPEDPRSLIDGIAFVHEIARHDTHLSSILRPLFVASNRYWILGGQAGLFDSWSYDSHALADGTHLSSRRYFFSGETVLKCYFFDHPRGSFNKAEFSRELEFLNHPPTGFSAPRLILHCASESEGWIVLQRLPGRLLLDLLREGTPVDSRAVLLAVLRQLALLEDAGLYHNDVRTWNVIVDEGGATHLIDYGSIGTLPQDCVWPENLFFSFLIFVREVVSGVVDDPNPLRTIAISPFGLPEPYKSWAAKVWHRPPGEWSFNLMYQSLLEMPDSSVIQGMSLNAYEVWMKAIEEAIQSQMQFNRYIVHQAETKTQQAEAESRAQVAEAKAQQAEAESRAQVAEAKAQQAEAESRAQQLEVQLHAVRNELHAVHQSNHHYWQLAEARVAEILALRNSTSWRITAPLRAVMRLAQKLTSRQIKPLLNQPLQHAALYANRRPWLRRPIVALLNRIPSLKMRLQRLSVGQPMSPPPPPSVPMELAHLTPRARQIHADLKSALARRQQEKA